MPESQKLEALAVLVLLVGVIQLLAGVFRLGFLVRFVSNAVMTGFLNGVAVLIILGQLGDLTGFDSQFSNRVAQTLELIAAFRPDRHPGDDHRWADAGRDGLVAEHTAAQVRLYHRDRRGDPAAGDFDPARPAHGRRLRERADRGRYRHDSAVFAPAGAAHAGPDLCHAAAGLLGGHDRPDSGAGVSQGTPNPDGKYPDVSRDFVGQGIANIATGFVGGVPAGGSISGTALLMGAGAKSRWANISAGLFVALIVLLVAPLVERVPMPALAALLIVAGFQGLRMEQAQVIWNTGKLPAAVMTLTFVATLFVPLQYAVLLGIAFSIVLHVFNQSNKVIVTRVGAAAGRVSAGTAGAQAGALAPAHPVAGLRQPVFCRSQVPGGDPPNR